MNYANKEENTKWHSIRSGTYCPVCNSKKGRCSVLKNEDTGEPIMYYCKYAPSDRPKGNGWYIHLVSEMNGTSPQYENARNFKIDNWKYEPISDELLDLRNRVYRKFKEIFVNLNGGQALFPHHKADLIKRGLNEETINKLGCFSMPTSKKVFCDGYTCKMSTAIVNELLKTFKPADLIRVAGFKKSSFTDKKGNIKDFVSFTNSLKYPNEENFEDMDAYFCLYEDYKGRLVSLQYRLMKPIVEIKEDGSKKITKYLWFSSKEATSGSLIDYYIPKSLNKNKEDYIILIEGALKGRISSEYLGIRCLSEAGVGNYQRLVKELQLLEEKEEKKYTVLLALDMDKYSNPDVLAAEHNTIALLKTLGYSVSVVEWDVNDGKGLDDKLVKSKEGFRFLSI